MNHRTLERRGISAFESVPGSLPRFQLAFTYDGYDGAEPRFANIEPLEEKDGVAVHGVAHSLNPAAMQLLDKFEGAGTAYERFEATFISAPDVPGAARCLQVQAYRALPSHRVPPGLPSARYCKILADGAEENNLPSSYVATLRTQPAFDCSGVDMPRVPEGAQDVTMAEVRNHSYSSDTGAVWVAVGGLVFNVTEGCQGHAMLRNMSGGDGSQFVLKLWATAFGTGAVEDYQQDCLVMAELQADQFAYVASWAQHLVSHYPCVGVLRAAL